MIFFYLLVSAWSANRHDFQCISIKLLLHHTRKTQTPRSLVISAIASNGRGLKGLLW